MKYVVTVLAIAGCWTSSTSTPVTTPASPQPTPAAHERRATVRIDAEPGSKRFQGVWLEFADGARWVIDYRAREPWRSFQDREVLVTGGCYEPLGQAIMATHFRVDRMRLVDPVRGRQPYLEVGPEQLLHGELVIESAPTGSKLAGTSALTFRVEDGTRYPVTGDGALTPAGPVAVRARVLLADLTYAARTGDSDLWILDVHDPDYTPDPSTQPTPRECP